MHYMGGKIRQKFLNVYFPRHERPKPPNLRQFPATSLSLPVNRAFNPGLFSQPFPFAPDNIRWRNGWILIKLFKQHRLQQLSPSVSKVNRLHARNMPRLLADPQPNPPSGLPRERTIGVSVVLKRGLGKAWDCSFLISNSDLVWFRAYLRCCVKRKVGGGREFLLAFWCVFVMVWLCLMMSDFWCLECIVHFWSIYFSFCS